MNFSSTDDEQWDVLKNMSNFWMGGVSLVDGRVKYYAGAHSYNSSCIYTEPKALRLGILVDLDLIQVED